MSDSRVPPTRTIFILCFCVLSLASVCFGQNQTRYLAYSTYAPQPGGVSGAAVNSAGQLCVAGSALSRLDADGTLAYSTTIPFLYDVAMAIDTAGNCYFATEQLFLGRPLTVSKYDSQGTLVLSLNYAGSGLQVPYAMAVDGSGNIWVTGKTTSNDLQTVNPIQSALNGTQDAFVAEFNSTGAPIFSTYFGGSGVDQANALTVDASGNVYVGGQTSSTDFPLLNPFEGSLTGSQSAFLTKISSAGNLVYSTYLGTTLGGDAQGVATDASLDMFVAGAAKIVKLNAAGSAVLYSVSSTITEGQLAVDSQGNAYTAGCLNDSGCPALVNPIQTDQSSDTLFVLDPNGNIIFSTYLGGTTSGIPASFVGVDSAGNLYAEVFTLLEFPVPLLSAVNGTYPPAACYVDSCDGSASVLAKIALGTGASFSMPVQQLTSRRRRWDLWEISLSLVGRRSTTPARRI